MNVQDLRNWSVAHKRLWLAMTGFRIGAQAPLPSTASEVDFSRLEASELALFLSTSDGLIFIGKYENFDAMFASAWACSHEVADCIQDALSERYRKFHKRATREHWQGGDGE